MPGGGTTIGMRLPVDAAAEWNARGYVESES